MDNTIDVESKLAQHNVEGVNVTVEVRAFNSLTRFTPGSAGRQSLTLPAGSRIEDILGRLRIPSSQVYMVWVNGRDVTASLHDSVNLERVVDDGDVVALSGPVPYSWGFGSPVL
ncbi:MAG: hypothetical protein KIT00_11895 [Rhodospirillales bacterium]|nr:hypothetical protein [Rhodospirillales bacterium]